MKKILVAGGAGFIGFHLCRKLLDQGNQVICLDNLQTGSFNNISELLSDKNFRFLKRDVVEPLFIDVDQIYNLACPASPIHYQSDPVKTTVTSVMGAINLLNLAKETGATILQASTSEVYGDPEVHPQTEDYWGHVNCTGIRSCYDEGKRAAETLFFDYYRQYQTNIRVIRIFNTYGPYMAPDDGRVVSNFIIQAINNQNITIYGDGSQTRSFQFVDDLVGGMIKMMNNNDSFVGPVNIGNPGEFTIKELAENILRLIPESASKIICEAAVIDDPKQRKPDISLAKRTLNWEPKINLEEGLKKTIEYFKATSKR
ncbi:MAG: UDP-glucuronic acid decarboxylase family protein [Patescibacteria group bacterium]